MGVFIMRQRRMVSSPVLAYGKKKKKKTDAFHQGRFQTHERCSSSSSSRRRTLALYASPKSENTMVRLYGLACLALS